MRGALLTLTLTLTLTLLTLPRVLNLIRGGSGIARTSTSPSASAAIEYRLRAVRVHHHQRAQHVACPETLRLQALRHTMIQALQLLVVQRRGVQSAEQLARGVDVHLAGGARAGHRVLQLLQPTDTTITVAGPARCGSDLLDYHYHYLLVTVSFSYYLLLLLLLLLGSHRSHCLRRQCPSGLARPATPPPIYSWDPPRCITA